MLLLVMQTTKSAQCVVIMLGTVSVCKPSRSDTLRLTCNRM